MPQNPFVRVIAVLALSLSLAAGVFLWWQAQQLDSAKSSQVTSSGTALVGGPFQLTDHNGEPRSEADLKGSYALIYFGYTYCPDICPATLSLMTQAIDRLAVTDKGKADCKLTVLFTLLQIVAKIREDEIVMITRVSHAPSLRELPVGDVPIKGSVYTTSKVLPDQ